MKKLKRMRLFIILAIAMALALPTSVSATEAPPEGAGGGMLQMEIRYAAGETPDIPQEMTRFGFTYYLVSVSDPVLESELPTVRTYTYRIDGALTPEQKANIEGLGDLNLTEVMIVFEEEVDMVATIRMPANDVDDVPKTRIFSVTSGTDLSGFEDKALTLTGVSFDLAKPEYDKYGKPAGYIATAIYRGIQTYSDVGYYLAEAVFTTYEEEEGTEIYVVVAEYRTEDMPPPIDEVEVAAAPPEPVEPGAGPETISDDIVALQGGNPIMNLIDGLVPLGGLNVGGVWSFLSLLFSFAALCMAGLFAVLAAMRQRRVADLAKLGVHNEARLIAVKRRGVILRVLTIIFGLITLMSWIFLDNLSNGMVWINENTVTVGVLFAITIGLCGLANLRDKKYLRDDVEAEKEGVTGEFMPA